MVYVLRLKADPIPAPACRDEGRVSRRACDGVARASRLGFNFDITTMHFIYWTSIVRICNNLSYLIGCIGRIVTRGRS